MTSITPQPQTYVNSFEIDRIDISILQLQLGLCVTIQAYIYSKNLESEPIRKIITIDGEDYRQWGSDDNYLVQLVCVKLGVIL